MQELTKWVRQKHNKNDTDSDKWDYRELSPIGQDIYRNNVHRMVMTVLKAGMITEKSRPRNHLLRNQSRVSLSENELAYTRKVFTTIVGSSVFATAARTSGYGESLMKYGE